VLLGNLFLAISLSDEYETNSILYTVCIQFFRQEKSLRCRENDAIYRYFNFLIITDFGEAGNMTANFRMKPDIPGLDISVSSSYPLSYSRASPKSGNFLPALLKIALFRQ